MKIQNQGESLHISEIEELTAVNSTQFREEVSAALPGSPLLIEIDLAQTRFVDSSGLGALFSISRATAYRNGMILRLLNPRPAVEQLLDLTQMRQLFEIIQR